MGRLAPFVRALNSARREFLISRLPCSCTAVRPTDFDGVAHLLHGLVDEDADFFDRAPATCWRSHCAVSAVTWRGLFG